MPITLMTGLPHTAPKFDELTKPTVAPVPVACVASAKKCHCYTQQGTRMNVRDQQCQRQKTDQSVADLKRETPLPLSQSSTADVPGRNVVVMDANGYGVLGTRPGTGKGL